MIYAGEQTAIFQGDGNFHFVAIGDITILGVNAISFEPLIGVRVYCDGKPFVISRGGQASFDGIKYCSQVAIHDAGVFGVNTGVVTINYVSGSSTPEQILYNTHVAEVGTTTPQVLNGFTYGEITIGLFLFFLVLMTFFGGMINQVSGVKARARNTRNPKI